MTLKFLESEKFLYFFATVVSLTLSMWIVYQEPVINTDAICYLLSAETMGREGSSRQSLYVDKRNGHFIPCSFMLLRKSPISLIFFSLCFK